MTRFYAGCVAALTCLAIGSACDPVWWIRRDAQPRAPLTADCVEKAVRAVGVRVTTHTSSSDPTWHRLWSRVGAINVAVTYHLNDGEIRRIVLATRGVGGWVSSSGVKRVREAQQALLEQLIRTCGPIARGVETCTRADCGRGRPAP